MQKEEWMFCSRRFAKKRTDNIKVVRQSVFDVQVM